MINVLLKRSFLYQIEQTKESFTSKIISPLNRNHEYILTQKEASHLYINFPMVMGGVKQYG